MINKESIKAIHAELTAAVKEVAARHNLTVMPSKIGYSATDFKFTVSFGDRTEIGERNPAFIKTLRQRGWRFGLGESDLGTTFRTSKDLVTVEGMRGNRVVGKQADGKCYLYDPVMVNKLLRPVAAA